MRWIFAIGLSVLLWATSVRTAPFPSDAVVTISGVEACAVTGEAPDRDSNRQWRAEHYPSAVVTESLWKSAPVHAGLGSTRSARIFELARSGSSPAPPLSSAPLYLRHTPLLI